MTKIIGIFGGLGTGKTLSLVILALMYKKEGYKIYTNMSNSLFADYSMENFFSLYLNPQTIDNEPKLLAIDEMHIYLNSRESMSIQNKIITSLIFQSRKRNIDIAFTTQRIKNIDIRLRDLINIYIFPKIIKRNPDNSPAIIQWKIVNDNDKYKTVNIKITPEILQAYNTAEIIPILNLKEYISKLSDDYQKLFINNNAKDLNNSPVDKLFEQ